MAKPIVQARISQERRVIASSSALSLCERTKNTYKTGGSNGLRIISSRRIDSVRKKKFYRTLLSYSSLTGASIKRWIHPKILKIDGTQSHFDYLQTNPSLPSLGKKKFEPRGSLARD